jgi:hypothetical protein
MGSAAEAPEGSKAMKCPICGSDAEEIEKGMGDLITIRCPNHEFEFSDTIRSEPPRNAKQWELALIRAKQRVKPGERPRILTYDF